MAIAARRLINGCILAHDAEISSTDHAWWSPTSPQKMMGKTENNDIFECLFLFCFTDDALMPESLP